MSRSSGDDLGGGPPPPHGTYWVVAGEFLAGPYPGSTNPAEHRAKVAALVDAGIRTFINLTEENEKNLAGRPFEPYEHLVSEYCRNSPAVCLRFAIRDLSVPTPELMVAILNATDESLRADRPVYVHCWGGVGRTGLVVGCWLTRHGLARGNNVLEEIRHLRRAEQERGSRPSPETEAQRRFLLAWQEGT